MKVYKDKCKNCLLSPDSIVSPARRTSILASCIEDKVHFVCHNSSMNDGNVCCKGFYDGMKGVSEGLAISDALGMTEFIDQPDTDIKLSPFKSKFKNR